MDTAQDMSVRRSASWPLLLLCLLIIWSPSLGAQPKPTYSFTGSLSHQDFQTYKLLPFAVPPGTKRITIEFFYTGREQRTVIDLGLFDPQRFRGWSGGNKSSFTISEVDATPSYLPGPLPPGTWNLLLGIPNIRPGVNSEYVAQVFLSSSLDRADAAPSQPQSIRREAGWYRGDLHTHTGHSDGSCTSLGGKKVPCPEFKLLETAAARGLDFLAVTDHNTTSTYNALHQWQAYFDTLLLIRGREITTFQGHANIYGTSSFVDFRLGSEGRTVRTLLDQVHRASAILSINHPQRISGEDCMGCGWTAKPQTDFGQIDAIEVVNGPDAETPISGIPFWQEQLNRGHRITAIGGSDDHQAGAELNMGLGIGIPTTVVHASELSEKAILEGVKGGHIYLKLKGPRGPDVFLSATCSSQNAIVGDNLHAAAGAEIRFAVQVVGGQGSTIEIVHNGEVERLLPDPQVHAQDETKRFDLIGDGGRHWYLVNLRGPDGSLLVLTNPIYINFPERFPPLGALQPS